MRLGLIDRFRVRAVRSSWRLYQCAAFHVTVNLEGVVLHVPILHGAGLVNIFKFDSWMIPVLRRIFAHRSGALVDVGANLGQMLLALQAVARDIPYLGFEPNVVACAYVQEIIRANALTAHRILPVGLSDASRILELQLDSSSDPCASILPHFRPPGFFSDSRPVVLQLGDSLLQQAGCTEIAVIKLDVEGAELEALRGLEDTIARTRPWLLFEVLGYLPIRSGRVFADLDPLERARLIELRSARIGELESWLRARDYQWLRIQQGAALMPVSHLRGDETCVESNYLGLPTADARSFFSEPPTPREV